MPNPSRLEKAEIRELDDRGEQTGDRSNWTTVQFNPETLKVSFSNQVVPPPSQSGSSSGSTGDQRGTSTIQFVGKGTTKLSVTLWFDVTGTLPSDQSSVNDVQELTRKVIYYITPIQDRNDTTKYKPPGVRFVWGSFQFDGIMESLEESLEFFGPDGRPLRASVNVSMTKQEILSTFRPTNASSGSAAGAGAGSTPGQRPLTQARSGDSLQGIASSRGLGDSWQDIAAANGIENPRRLDPGQLIDVNIQR